MPGKLRSETQEEESQSHTTENANGQFLLICGYEKPEVFNVAYSLILYSVHSLDHQKAITCKKKFILQINTSAEK